MKTRFPMVPFRELLLNRRRVLEETAARGTKIVGYFCTYTPIEAIHACGMTPVRIWGGTGQAEKAYNLVPTFICPYTVSLIRPSSVTPRMSATYFR
ncbi:MAG TPA: hypothetical protein PK380_11360 [Deltaproteobacteria bacterium]|nr:hypothetical protein [Deltaproteobacteria bacterium]